MSRCFRKSKYEVHAEVFPYMIGDRQKPVKVNVIGCTFSSLTIKAMLNKLGYISFEFEPIIFSF